MELKRQGFIAGAVTAATCAAFIRFPGDAAEFSMKLGNDVPVDDALNVRTVDAANRIKNDTNGRLEIAVFPNSQLGSTTAMMTQVRSGAIELLEIANGSLAPVAPVLGMDSMPYIFNSYAAGWAARDGVLGDLYRRALSAAGLYLLPKSMDIGYRQMFNRIRPIATAADLKGIKLRVPAIPTEVVFFKALDCSPVAISANEEYSALQQGVADGAEHPVEVIYTGKLYEVSKYLSITNHISQGYTAVANSAAWERLPRNLQKIVEDNLGKAAIDQRKDVVANEKAIIAKLGDAGMIVNRADTQSFKVAVSRAGLYRQWRQQYGEEAWRALEQAVGPVT
jgi:tripartite ATP-independent transporter DctP family solute receptor